MSYKRWYKTARWQKLRWSILVRDLFTCAMCGWSGPDTSKLVADHKDPHRGDPEKFWDERNLQVLCKPCHDGAKQSIEKGGSGKTAIGPDGWHVDPWGGERESNEGTASRPAAGSIFHKP